MNASSKIVFVGAGMVGASGLYSCINKNIASEYIIIDIFADFAEGQKLDLEDAIIANNSSASIKTGDYSECSDADIIVISAGRPQRQGETRLEMLQDNVKIISDIAHKIKNSGFTGISLIVSNPVDIMTTVYQQETGFDARRVISSGCSLDTVRLRHELRERGCDEVSETYMIGEHGDSSVGVFGKLDISDQDKRDIENIVHKKAYEIIDKKKATYYGIGVVISQICSTILTDSQEIFSVGRLVTGEYGQSGVYASLPALIGKEGIIGEGSEILSSDEITGFQKSCDVLQSEYSKISL